MTISNISEDQMGQSLDHRNANKRAHWQPRTNVSETNRGTHVQSRTHVWNANRERTTKKHLNICTYNPQSISDLNSADLDIMLAELEKMKWDIVGISASQIKESSVEILPSGHYLFNSGNETSRSNGTGFLVHKSLAPFISDYKNVSDRLALLSIQGKETKITFIQAYFPTLQHPDEEIDALYNQIQEILDGIPSRDFVFVMGDFNARVGGLDSTYPNCVGKHTIGSFNTRGERLATFCSANNLYITNTYFKKRRLHTWNHPNGRNKAQIDFILSRNKFCQNVTNASVLNTPSISDHRLLRVEVKTSYTWQKPKSKIKRFDISGLKDNNKHLSFQLELSNRFLPLINAPPANVEELSNSINESLIKTAEKVIPSTKTASPSWLKEDTLRAINNKKVVRQTHGDSSTQYKAAKVKSKKLVKRDKLSQLNENLDEISTLPPDKQFFLAMKKLKTTRRNISWGIKNKNGEILTSREEILERWALFYEELYDDPNTCDPLQTNQELPIPHMNKQEIISAINKLASGKSPGIDQIHSEFLKAGGDAMVNILHILFNRILETGDIPSSFKKALIVVLYKKGDRSECKNYRPISLLSHVYKLFMTIIGNRIIDDLYFCFPESQAAYQPSRGTIEQIFALNQMIEKSIEFNKPLYLIFIDFTKAFDSIKLDKLWLILDRTPLNKNYINLLKAVYDDSQASIKTDLGTSRFVNIKKGVKQGDMLSAILFCVALAAVMLRTEETCQSGFSIGGQILTNLSYADDIALTNECPSKLQLFVNELANNAKEIGLEINLTKTECMSTDKEQTPLNLTIYDKAIKQVTEFIYLGHKLTSSSNHLVALKHRIGLGWAAFQKNSCVLKSKRVPISVKVKVYNIYVLPVVLYGLDCITWTKKLSNCIEVFQNHIMRFILGHKLIDKINISTLRNKTSLPPIFDVVRSRTLKLFGHVKRSSVGFSKLCFEGMIQGKRGRGKPKQRWRNNILTWTNIGDWNTINRLALDRKEWKRISHVGSQSANGGNSDP